MVTKVYVIAAGGVLSARLWVPVALGASQLGAAPGFLQVYSCEKPLF